MRKGNPFSPPGPVRLAAGISRNLISRRSVQLVDEGLQAREKEGYGGGGWQGQIVWNWGLHHARLPYSGMGAIKAVVIIYL